MSNVKRVGVRVSLNVSDPYTIYMKICDLTTLYSFSTAYVRSEPS